EAAKRFRWPGSSSLIQGGSAQSRSSDRAATAPSPSTGDGRPAVSLPNRCEGEALPLASAPLTGIGLACGTEKGSFVAACAEVAIDRENNRIRVTRVSQVFECGKIVNPGNLLSQVQGAIMMGIGPALREEMRFENGKITNAAFSKYRVPRMDDMPQLDVHLLDRPDLPSAGAGETPIVAIAPAIANAVSRAIGKRIRGMPIKL
ncbi:MAG TPA: molybdopterin cofactor-binding domain-containing protein, partial [Pirellulales bacterium]